MIGLYNVRLLIRPTLEDHILHVLVPFLPVVQLLKEQRKHHFATSPYKTGLRLIVKIMRSAILTLDDRQQTS